jgi:hypothetical protein
LQVVCLGLRHVWSKLLWFLLNILSAFRILYPLGLTLALPSSAFP